MKKLVNLVKDYWAKSIPEQNKLIEYIKENDIERLDRLISERNINVNQYTKQGFTLMIYAAYFNKPLVIDYLVNQRGCQVDALSKNQDTALIRACYYGRYDAAQTLLKLGADPNKHKYQAPVVLACLRRSPQVIYLLVRYGAQIEEVFRDNELYQEFKPEIKDVIGEVMRWNQRKNTVFVIKYGENSFVQSLPFGLKREMISFLQ